MASELRLFVYDFTLWNKDVTPKEINLFLKQIAKSWAFQLEEGEEKKAHYQGRFSLFKKTRLHKLVGMCIGEALYGAHFTATATVNSRKFNYVMKLEGRLLGPWTDKDEEEPQEEPNEIKGKLLYPWQRTLENCCTSREEVLRAINVIIDSAGGAGKGFIRKYLEFKRIAKTMPHVQDAKTLSAWALKWPMRAYIIDIPRDRTTHGKRKHTTNTELWVGIELLKDGRAVETRYKPQDLQMVFSPHIWVLTNEVPPWHALSEDRWVPWLICPKTKTLIRWTQERMDKIQQFHNDDRQNKKRRVEMEQWYKDIVGTDQSEWDEVEGKAMLPTARLRVNTEEDELVDPEDVPPTPPPSPQDTVVEEGLGRERTEFVDTEGFGLGE